MNCEEGNKVDLIEYLYSIGFTPTKIRSNQYWYLSPLRNEKEASFKIERTKNVWYDHGTGNGGTLVDFITAYFHCDVSTALQKLSSFLQVTRRQIVPVDTGKSFIQPKTTQPELFFPKIGSEQQVQQEKESINYQDTNPPFHLHENSLIHHKDTAETALKIIAAKKPITDPFLCRYLKQRRIDKYVADLYCYEITFKFSNSNKEHLAIGFKNSAGGYELRSEYFKLSSSPKYVTYIDTAKQNHPGKVTNETDCLRSLHEVSFGEKSAYKKVSNLPSIVSQKEVLNSTLKIDLSTQDKALNQSPKYLQPIAVFEGFFDFLTYQTIHQKQPQPLTDFLILNSLAFFERSLLLMERHERIHLFLDHDTAGRKSLDVALKRSPKYKDESSLYKRHKDLNDWVVNFGKLQHKPSFKRSNKIGLL